MNRQEHDRIMTRVIANAWLDPKYKARLKTNPKEVLKEAGIVVPKNVTVHEESEDTGHVVIPRRPAHIKDEDLKRAEPHPDMCCSMC